MSGGKDKPGVLAPITWDVHIHVESLDGLTRGKVTVGQSPGVVPTEASVKRALAQALKALPEGYRLMRPDNYLSLLIEEKTGVRQQWASSKEFHFDADALEAEAAATDLGDDDE